MSLNDGITQKQRGRAELEALVAAFQQSGGTVTRSREHRATAECRICGAPPRPWSARAKLITAALPALWV